MRGEEQALTRLDYLESVLEHGQNVDTFAATKGALLSFFNNLSWMIPVTISVDSDGHCCAEYQDGGKIFVAQFILHDTVRIQIKEVGEKVIALQSSLENGEKIAQQFITRMSGSGA